MQNINIEYLPQLITKLEELCLGKKGQVFVNQYRSKGGLSEKQMSSAQAMLDKMAVNKLRLRASKVSTLKNRGSFAVALSNGLKRPRFHCGDVLHYFGW